jgi:hypothetical protein
MHRSGMHRSGLSRCRLSKISVGAGVGNGFVSKLNFDFNRTVSLQTTSYSFVASSPFVTMSQLISFLCMPWYSFSLCGSCCCRKNSRVARWHIQQVGWDTLCVIEVTPAVHFRHRHHASNILCRLRLRVTRNQLYVDAVVHVVTQSSSDQNIAIEQRLQRHP